MSFFKLAEVLPRSKNTDIFHIGVVKKNNDSNKIGRIKVEIAGFLEGEPEVLPWVYPVLPAFLGGSSNSMMFSVPEINSKVLVLFPFNSVYFGFYMGVIYSNAEKNAAFDEDYPNSYGFKDSSGFSFNYNKASKKMVLTHPSGAIVEIEESGKTKIKSSDNITVESSGEIIVKGTLIKLN